MIDEKKIEEAAVKYSAEEWLSDDCMVACADGFHAGIDWFKHNLWHDIDECNNIEFDDEADVLGADIYGALYSMSGAELWADQTDYVKWLYIEDLKNK